MLHQGRSRVTVATSPERDRTDVDPSDAALLAGLAARGCEAEHVAWDDPSHDWAQDDLVLLGAGVGVPQRDALVAWADAIGVATRLGNPASVIRWNTDLLYLRELEDRGAPIVPTVWVAQHEPVDLGRQLRRRGWSTALVRPAVDAGEAGLLRVVRDDPADVARGQDHLDALTAHGVALFQPAHAESVLSLVYVDGQYAHAVRGGQFDDPRLSSGDARLPVREDPATKVVDLGAWLLEATGERLLHARVDLVADESGVLLLSGIEAARADLHLDLAPDGLDRFLKAIVARLGPDPDV